MRRELFIIGLSALLAVVGVACGGRGPAPTPTPPIATTGPVATADPTATSTSAPAQALEISVNGNELKFDKDELGVAAGGDAELVFHNASSINQHNWVLVKAGTKDEVAQRGLEGGAETDFVKPEDPDVIARTKLVGPGERGEVCFTVPPAGAYQFVCTFPGHNFTMFGDFVVTP